MESRKRPKPDREDVEDYLRRVLSFSDSKNKPDSHKTADEVANRDCNIVIYGLPEVRDEKETRDEYIDCEKVRVVQRLDEDVGIALTRSDIASVQRLGIRTKSNPKPRPLRVVLENKRLRDRILETVRRQDVKKIAEDKPDQERERFRAKSQVSTSSDEHVRKSSVDRAREQLNKDATYTEWLRSVQARYPNMPSASAAATTSKPPEQRRNSVEQRRNSGGEQHRSSGGDQRRNSGDQRRNPGEQRRNPGEHHRNPHQDVRPKSSHKQPKSAPAPAPAPKPAEEPFDPSKAKLPCSICLEEQKIKEFMHCGHRACRRCSANAVKTVLGCRVCPICGKCGVD